MKRLITLLSLVFLLLPVSCEKQDKQDTSEEVKIAFAQNPLIVECSSASGYDCGLIINSDWTASSTDNWLTLVTSSGSASSKLTINIEANEDDSDRNGTIVVKSGASSKTLTLCQYGTTSSGFVSTTKVQCSTYNDNKNVTVNCPAGWSIKDKTGDFYTVTAVSETVAKVSAEINFSGQSRSGSFRICANDGSCAATIKVTQLFNNEKFLASTEYGRRLVYAMDGYIKSVSSDTYKEMTDGVISYELKCTLADVFASESSPKARSIYIWEVDMTKATIVATLKDDDDSNINVCQEMSKQIPALAKSRTGLTVYGGTNGDFFTSTETPIVPFSPLYRKGVCLYDTFSQTTNNMFAVYSDGTAHCVKQADYNSLKSSFQEAVGGRQILMWGGDKYDYTDVRQEPRTAIGVTQDGKKVWLLVADGRQETYSTGSYSVSYDVLARFLKALGAYNGMNLDGGGSSSYVVLESDGTYKLHNIPSNTGRSERAVLNGLAVVKNK